MLHKEKVQCHVITQWCAQGEESRKGEMTTCCDLTVLFTEHPRRETRNEEAAREEAEELSRLKIMECLQS